MFKIWHFEAVTSAMLVQVTPYKDDGGNVYPGGACHLCLKNGRPTTFMHGNARLRHVQGTVHCKNSIGKALDDNKSQASEAARFTLDIIIVLMSRAVGIGGVGWLESSREVPSSMHLMRSHLQLEKFYISPGMVRVQTNWQVHGSGCYTWTSSSPKPSWPSSHCQSWVASGKASLGVTSGSSSSHTNRYHHIMCSKLLLLTLAICKWCQDVLSFFIPP